MLTKQTLEQFIGDVASSSPAPGGGSVAATAGALAAALTSMVCNLTIGKKKYAAVQEEMQTILKGSELLRARLTELIDEDTAAFNKVMAAFDLPKETEEQRTKRDEAIEAATRDATVVPLDLLRVCDEGLGLAARVAEKGNRNSLSDAGVAVALFQAAASGAAMNVRINLGGIKDEAFRSETAAETDRFVRHVTTLAVQALASITAGFQ